jgi:hypothetical protein
VVVLGTHGGIQWEMSAGDMKQNVVTVEEIVGGQQYGRPVMIDGELAAIVPTSLAEVGNNILLRCLQGSWLNIDVFLS